VHPRDIKPNRTYISLKHGSEYRVDRIDDGPLRMVHYTIVSGPNQPQCQTDLEDFAKRVCGLKLNGRKIKK
jgi:hypothetical protein